MLAYLVRRLVLAVVTIWAITVVTFVIIQLPPGDFVDAYIAQAAAMGSAITQEEADALRQAYGLDEPLLVQYLKWLEPDRRAASSAVSFEFGRPVTEVIGDRLWLTILLSIGAIIVTWGIALPIGIYSAVRQYSVGDYFFTFVGFIGLAVPNFLLALIVMYLASAGSASMSAGCSRPSIELAPWSLAKVWDLMKHLPLPVLILALAGTAQLVRIMRANLLDELRRPYVVTARAKGLPERRVILKYPVRAALNPFASTIGYLLPFVVSGSIIVSVVLSLPTVGPLLLRSLVVAGHAAGLDHHPAPGRADGDRHLPLGPAADVDRSQDPPGACTDEHALGVAGRASRMRRGRREGRGREPAAAHLVALPPAPAGGVERRASSLLFYLVGDLRRLPRHHRPARSPTPSAASSRRRRSTGSTTTARSRRTSSGSRACATRAPSSSSTRRTRTRSAT